MLVKIGTADCLECKTLPERHKLFAASQVVRIALEQHYSNGRYLQVLLLDYLLPGHHAVAITTSLPKRVSLPAYQWSNTIDFGVTKPFSYLHPTLDRWRLWDYRQPTALRH